MKKKVSTLKENQKIKENDGYLNLDSIALNKHKSELKEIKDKEEKLISRIDEINNQIEGLIYEEQKVKYNENKRKILKECIDNIERDRELAEARMKKYEDEQRQREEKKRNDIEEICERVKQEINEKEKKEAEDNKKKIDDFMQKQRKIIVTRNKANTEKLTLIKVYINEKPPQNKEDYLYYKQEKNYLTREENFLMKEKAKMKN